MKSSLSDSDSSSHDIGSGSRSREKRPQIALTFNTTQSFVLK